jgi:hypothetical protein
MKDQDKTESDASPEEQKENEEEDETLDEEETRKRLGSEHGVPIEKPTLIGKD